MRALLDDDSPEALLRAVVLYHVYVEGVAAESGYSLYYALFERSGRFPGLERGIHLIQRDEERHIAFGVHVLRRLLADRPRLVDPFEEQVAALRPLAEADPDQVLAGFEPSDSPFGLDHAAYRRRYRDRLEEMRRRVRDVPR